MKDDRDMNSLYIIKVWLTPSPQKVKEINGGWIPVAINVANGKAVCVFKNIENAKAYSVKESQTPPPAGMSVRYEVSGFDYEQLRRISRMMGHQYVSLDPSYGPYGPAFESFVPMDALRSE